MSRTIDIDVGGTFTDLVLTWDERRITAKAPTTPYDLSVGFLDVSPTAPSSST